MGEFVTRQKRRKGSVSFDGAFSGALQVIPITFTSGNTTSLAYPHTIDLPAGMSLRIVAIDVQSVGLTDTPTVTVGTAKAGTQVVASVGVTTNLGALTLKGGDADGVVQISAGGIVDVRVTNNTTALFEVVNVDIYAYVSAPPTSLVARNIDHA